MFLYRRFDWLIISILLKMYQPFLFNLPTRFFGLMFKKAFVRGHVTLASTVTFSHLVRSCRAVARALIGGGGVYIHIFVLCPTNFF